LRIERLGRALPYSREQIFDIAADVERYPQFLRWWVSARVLRREAQVLHVEQVLGAGPAQLRFTSTALLQRPERLDVSSPDPMFRKFNLCFLVSDQGPKACSLRITAELELRSRLQQLVVGATLSSSVEEILAAFEVRARELYGAH
jgi:coenzyme Q-binding protein COQ10